MQRPNYFYIAIAVLLTMIFSVAGYAVESPAKVYRLKFASYWSPTSGTSKVWEDFCKEVEKRSEGQVKFDYYPGSSLLSGNQMADGIAEGLADVGYFNIAYKPGVFPATEVACLPPAYPSAFISCHVMDDFWRKFQLKELEKYHVLVGASIGPHTLFTNKPIRSLEDFKGKKLRIVGRGADIIKLLGGTPVASPAPEVYDSILKGVLDGAMMSMDAADNWKLAEIVKFATDATGISNMASYYIAMNKNSWDKLPKNLQAIIDAIALEWVDKSAREWNETDMSGFRACKTKGVEIIYPSPNELAVWEKTTLPVVDACFKDMIKIGFSEQELKSYREFVKNRTDYWLNKQIDLGIKSSGGPNSIRAN